MNQTKILHNIFLILDENTGTLISQYPQGKQSEIPRRELLH